MSTAARAAAAASLALTVVGCGLGDDPYDAAFAAELPAAPTWVADIQPRMDYYCVACHGPGDSDGPRSWDFSSYEVVKSALPAIAQQAMVRRSMPPGDAPRMTAADWATLQRWEATGFPLGADAQPAGGE